MTVEIHAPVEGDRASGKKTELVRMGLEALIAREAAKKLAVLGGSDRRARVAPRRRPG